MEVRVITPVTYSECAAPIVEAKKAVGSIQMCADFSTRLNRALEDHQYSPPVPGDIFILYGSTCFAKLDLTEAYLQVEVSTASSGLLTNTHHGLIHTVFGVKTAPAIFRQIDTMLTGVEGAAVYLDDILVVGRLKQELTE